MSLGNLLHLGLDSTMQTASVKFRNQTHKKKKRHFFGVAAVFDAV